MLLRIGVGSLPVRIAYWFPEGVVEVFGMLCALTHIDVIFAKYRRALLKAQQPLRQYLSVLPQRDVLKAGVDKFNQLGF